LFVYLFLFIFIFIPFILYMHRGVADDKDIDTDKSYDGTDRRTMIMGGDSLTKKSTFRRYDAVGPETITMLQLLQRFAKYQGTSISQYVSQSVSQYVSQSVCQSVSQLCVC
jgi:uncharacterized membrane protein